MKFIICERCGEKSYYGWALISVVYYLPVHRKKNSFCVQCEYEVNKKREREEIIKQNTINEAQRIILDIKRKEKIKEWERLNS